MLPQTLPIRFLLNRRGDTPFGGADRNKGLGCAPGGVRDLEADGSGWTDAPDAAESEPTPLRKLEGLGKALGLDILWFKEGPGNPGRKGRGEPGRMGRDKPGQKAADFSRAYAALAGEMLQELEGGPLPTHVFLQAGAGDLAAAVAGHLRNSLGERMPRLIVVEPANADCVLESALASRPTPATGSMETNMGSLASREVSPFAWAVLRDAADAFLSISEYAAEATVALLEEGVGADPTILTQPSGAAGLAGLIAASFEPALTGPLELRPGSRVLVVGWEGPA